MSADEPQYLRSFYQALDPTEPADPAGDRYLALYERSELSPSDPVAELQTHIEWAVNDSCQLFSGFRGTGKSTELRRLQLQLEAADPGRNIVLLCDMQDYLNLHTPVDVSDFLLAVAGAISDGLQDDAALGHDPAREGYWERFAAFLTRTNVRLDEVGASVGSGELSPVEVGAEVKVGLAADPTFKQKLQERMRGHIGALTRDVHLFVEECVKAVRARHGAGARLVVLFDSVEQIRGTPTNAGDVADSVANLFQGHADKLRIPYLHLVYTVPPWLKVKAKALPYDGYQTIPCVKVRHRSGEPCAAGLDAMAELLAKRGDWTRLFPDRSSLDAFSLASGGYLRDFFRLVQATLRLTRSRGLPAPEPVRSLAIAEVRNSYLPISHSDARWLCHIDATHACELPDEDDLPDLAKYFDNLLVMVYRNGDEWYGVHPLVLPEAGAIVRRLTSRGGGDTA